MKKLIKQTNILVVGTGLTGLNFIYEYLKKNKKINVISPNFNNSVDNLYYPLVFYSLILIIMRK
jgi:siroheme synthase (precorrin-2 oxidase/ferrochelatase)